MYFKDLPEKVVAPAIGAVPSFLLAQYPQDQWNNDTDEDHASDGNIDLQVGPVDDDVTGQPPDGHLSQPRPKEPDHKNHDPYDNQRFLHEQAVLF